MKKALSSPLGIRRGPAMREVAEAASSNGFAAGGQLCFKRFQTQRASPTAPALPVGASNSSAARPDVPPAVSHRRPVERL